MPETATITSDEAATLQSNPNATNTDSMVAGETSATSGKAVAETPRRFKYNFGLTVRGVYDDNINLTSANEDSAYYIAIEPFISLSLGNTDEGFNFLNFAYHPSFFLFFDTPQDDTVQHIIHIDGERRFSRLSLSVAQDVQILDGTDLNSISDPTGIPQTSTSVRE